MTLLLPGDRFAERRAAVSGPLAPLAASLEQGLERLRAHGVHVPEEKAQLSRVGGRCPTDGTLLDFDPYEPHAHRCPRCGAVWRDVRHDRFWLYWYQLWLAERAVHAALLGRLRGDARWRALAYEILEGYVERYLRYPNRDNVLGPTRVFFSTYLESIWLLQLVLAVDLLEGDEDDAARRDALRLGARVRERIVEPSVALIASYDEGGSNRQVWNDAALLAAGTLLDDAPLVEHALYGPSGIAAQLGGGLLDDGSWYEGENYHLFAHRGLWYGVTMAERLGAELPQELVRRFDAGFLAPLATVLPDLTLPSRRDSQYAISLRQPRFAEMAELGLARSGARDLAALLHSLYDAAVPRGETGQASTSADVERNVPATALTRADLGWRALLHAVPRLPPSDPLVLRSAHLPAQGIAVLRREAGEVYVALDYGHSGGGHGHPDRLNLLLADGPARWLDDMGTGSYVERTLHWYRSSLAHDAPLVDGRSQQRRDGELVAFDERGAAGWVVGRAEIARGVVATRTVVALTDYVVDELRWEAGRDVQLDLPIHLAGAEAPGGGWTPATLAGGDGLEDGFDFVRDAAVRPLAAGGTLRLRREEQGRSVELWLRAAADAEWWRVVAPGPPGAGDRDFHLLRTVGRAGRLLAVWGWRGRVRDVQHDGERLRVDLTDGTRHEHARTPGGWLVDLHAGESRSSIDLGGVIPEDEPEEPPRQPARAAPGRAPIPLPRSADAPDLDGARFPLRFELGADDYVRSEESWEEAGRPVAIVSLRWTGRAIDVDVDVRTACPPRFVAADAENPWDNEQPDIDGDSVQLYLRTPGWTGAWVLSPEPDGDAVRARAVPGWGSAQTPAPVARWRRTAHGWTLRARLPVDLAPGTPATEVALNVLVNETAPHRVRRRGQLALVGGGGWLYLRGDRVSPELLLPLSLSHG